MNNKHKINLGLKLGAASVMAVSVAWLSTDALAVTSDASAAKSQVQMAAELDGTAMLDAGSGDLSTGAQASGNVAPAIASAAVASKPASVPVVERHTASVWDNQTNGPKHRGRAEEAKKHADERKSLVKDSPKQMATALVAAAAAASAATAPSALKVTAPASAGTMPTPVSTVTTLSHAEAIVNPMTGQALSTEELRSSLQDETLRAEIMAQRLKGAQAESQMQQLKFVGVVPSGGPLPPKEMTLADVPKPAKVAAAPKKAPRKESEAALPPAQIVKVASPVTGVMTQGGVRYAVLQINGEGVMARAGETVHGRHVDRVDGDSVVLDGHVYAVATPISEIASVDTQARADGAGLMSNRLMPVTGGVTSTNTPNPFANNANGGLPPLTSVLSRAR
ncbi:hypothetical protein [Robbsia andropogonis]|uniref:hypothetical protein n=1 Tax=Robbsia andropogonis TaxID=28092 RepID=UPI002A69FAA7|nr:hypothetical protein [Robbsia andropogonis]